MNYIDFDGEKIKIGVTPFFVETCGFRHPNDVRRVAAKFAKFGEPIMKMDDVAEWFKTHQ